MSENLAAWTLIGAAASLAAMIYPFRRGLLGLLGNLAAGISGAIAVGFAGWLGVAGSEHHRSSWSLSLAAAGAVGVLALVHAVYSRSASRPDAARTPPGPRRR